MLIGIDGWPLTEVLTGIGHYTHELAVSLATNCERDGVTVVAPRPYLATVISKNSRSPNLEYVHSRSGLIARRWWSIGLPRYLKRKPQDVFHGTNFEIPLRSIVPSVLTIHDLSVLLHPETQERKLTLRAQRRLPMMARQATMVIVPTDAIRSEVHKYLKLPLETVMVVREAARSCFQPVKGDIAVETCSRIGIAGDFLLFVGTVEPRKNLSTLLRAFEEVSRSHTRPLQLVIAGRKGWLMRDLYADLRRSPVARHIVLAGYLPDKEIAALYSQCTAFIYPSIYEGFGLPPLEAMACGAPVIASSIPSITEVTGGAALLVNPKSVMDIAQAIIDLLKSPAQRRHLSEAGLRRAADFSWSEAAKRTREVYLAAIERHAATKRKGQLL